MKGEVKFYNESKGFGFITGEDGLDYFVHATDLSGEVLSEREEVEFTPASNDKGRKATKVRR